MTKDAPDTPKELDAIVDVVLAYKPKLKASSSNTTKRKAKKTKKEKLKAS